MEPNLINCPHCGKIISLKTIKNKQSQRPPCPQCGSRRNYMAGIRYTQAGEVQRYICRDCCYRFSA